MARSRISSAYSPRPTQRRRYLELPEIDLENDSEGVRRTNPQLDGNTSPQSTSVTITKYTLQEGATTAEQIGCLPSNPTVNESIPPQASSHADNSMVLREIQALKQTVEKMCTEQESRFLQLEKLITDRFDMLTNIMSRLSRFVQQQSETWKVGDRGESRGGGGEHSRSIDVRIITGGDIEAQKDKYAPTDVYFGTEISVERDIEDSPLNEIFYQTPTCSSDKDC